MSWRIISRKGTMRRHRFYQTRLPLLFYGELTEQERRELELHLAGCELCRRERDGIARLHSLLSRLPVPEPSEEFYRQARLHMVSTLGTLQTRRTVGERFYDTFRRPAFQRPAIGLAALLLLLLGFAAGRRFSSSPSGIPAGDARAMLSNFHVVKSPDGEKVELAFDQVTPVLLRGRIDDPEIQKILARAVLDGENAGVRLRAVGSLKADHASPLRHDVRAALLLALQTDKNDGVRKAALETLLRSPVDRGVSDALLQVLLNDKNPGLRIAAINGLDSLRVRGLLPLEEFPGSFRRAIAADENMYVRMKAKSILEEKMQ
jgi:hypothetical protein